MPRFKKPLMLAVLLMLSACATPTAYAPQTQTPVTKPTDTACTAFGPILFSRLHDTLETIAAVKAHNAAWTALCGPSK